MNAAKLYWKYNCLGFHGAFLLAPLSSLLAPGGDSSYKPLEHKHHERIKKRNFNLPKRVYTTFRILFLNSTFVNVLS